MFLTIQNGELYKSSSLLAVYVIFPKSNNDTFIALRKIISAIAGSA